jgi:hypothetical protein
MDFDSNLFPWKTKVKQKLLQSAKMIQRNLQAVKVFFKNLRLLVLLRAWFMVQICNCLFVN